MNKKFFLYLLLITIAGGIFYLPSIKSPFVWDDVVIIQDNSFIGGDLRILPKNFMTSDYFGISREGSYRPIPTLLYYWTGRLAGKNPAIFRAFNITLHIVASILVSILVWKIIGSESAGFISGLLFALHPVHSETIYIASFNEDILMTVFVLGAFLFYMNFRRLNKWNWLVLSVLFYLLGCLSKEPTIVVLPSMVVFYEEFYLRGVGGEKKNKWLIYSLYAIAGLIYLSMRVAVSRRLAFPFPSINWKELPGNLLGKGMASFWEYFRISGIMPFDLSADRTLNLGLFQSIAGIIVLCWMVYLGFFKYREKMGMWVVIFVVPLLPVLNVLPFYYYPVVAERYLYLPSVGVCAVCGWLAVSVVKSIKVRALLVASVSLLFAVSVMERGRDYSDNLVFWQRAVESSPRSFIARLSLGNEYLRRGKFADAEFQFNKAIELKPDYAEAYVNLGSLYGLRREYGAAMDFFNKAIKINPLLAKGYSGVGVMYFEKKNYKDAEKFFVKALDLDRTLVGVYYYLTEIYEQEKRLPAALQFCQGALSFAPSNIRILNKAGLIASQLGRYEEAEGYFKRVLSLMDGKSSEALVNLGNVFFMKKNYPAARDCWRKAQELSGRLAVAESNLRMIKDKTGE